MGSVDGWRLDGLPELGLPALDGLVVAAPAMYVVARGTAVDVDFLPMARERLLPAAMRRATRSSVGLVTIHRRDIPVEYTAAAFALGQRLWSLTRPHELVLTGGKPEDPDTTRWGRRLVERHVSIARPGRARVKVAVWEVMSPQRYALWRADRDR